MKASPRVAPLKTRKPRKPRKPREQCFTLPLRGETLYPEGGLELWISADPMGGPFIWCGLPESSPLAHPNNRALDCLFVVSCVNPEPLYRAALAVVKAYEWNRSTR